MKLWKASVAGLMTFAGLATWAQAQIPTAPPIPGGAAGASGLASGASGLGGLGGAAQPRNIFSFFGISKAGCQACKEKLCASNLGAMINGAMAPMSALSGGLIGPFCPTVPTANQLAAIAAGPGGANGPAATAAAIKANEADAKARVAAVEYLGTVDCNRYPAAVLALKSALRGDANECVRYAAARVMNNGCCCNKLTIDALKNVLITDKPTDSLPIETSERVRAAAMVALQTCQFRNPETIESGGGGREIAPPPPVPGNNREKPIGSAALNSADPEVRLSAYVQEVNNKSGAQVMAEARRELEKARRASPSPMMTTGNRSLMHALSRSRPQSAPARQAYVQSYAVEAPASVPLMTPASPSPMVPPTASTPVQGDPNVVGTSATMPAPDAPAARTTGGRSLSDVLQRSRSRSGQ